MDSLRSRPKKHQRTSAFTIVELLVVIVVIGVLAAITIVSYTGISQRATVASLTSDLTNAVTQLKLDQITNSTYPTNLAAANGGKGIPASSGTSYQYSYNNNSNPQTFCITATKGTTSYEITNDSVPTIGGCPGHGVGGVPAITNLATNPSAETDSSNWQFYTNGSATASRVSGGAFSGNWFYRVQYATSGNGGIYFYHLTVQPNTQYTLSGNIRTNNSRSVLVNIEWYDASSSPISSTPGSVSALSANTWTKLSVSGTAPSTAAYLTLTFYISGSTWNIGDTIDGDAIMDVQGSNTYNYADGNSANWIWNGTVNSSTSTGPPL